MFARLTLGTIALCTLAACTAFGAGSKPTPKSVGDGLICQCGCNQTVSTCNHIECSTRAEMNELIQKEITANKDETTILQDFMLRYGVKVLASPPQSGFNLTVWILPVLGLLVGLAAVVTIVKRWQRPGSGPALGPSAPVDPKVLAAVEKEMTGLGLRD